MANRSSIVVTALISLIIGAGIAYVGIPAVDPTYNTNNKDGTTATQSQTGVIHEILKTWKDESYIGDDQMSWTLMNQTQVNFTISANSHLMVQFSAPYLVYLDPTFTGSARWEVSLVIAGVGNTSTRIEFSDTNTATGNWREITFSPVLSIMSGKLSAGTYNCSVWWRSIFNPTGTNQLIVSSHNPSSTYHHDRWMDLKEIV